MDEIRRSKFEWKAEDVQVQLAQCYNCLYNEGKTCQKFTLKPDIYRLNKEPCPEKVVDPDY